MGMNALKQIGVMLLLLWGFPMATWAQPTTPRVLLNQKFSLVELARSQRATLSYDLRPIGGQYLKAKLYNHTQTLDQPPMREWLLDQAYGDVRISLEGLPLDVYTLVCYCSNAEGQPLAYAAPYINIEYGGWRAWEKFKPPVETVSTPPQTFTDIEVATNIQNRDVGIALEPPAVVIRPGQTATFRPHFKNMEAETVRWKLVGEGKLKALEDGAYLYTAPAEQLGTKLFRVEIQSVAHPDLQGGATILVTNADPALLEQP